MKERFRIKSKNPVRLFGPGDKFLKLIKERIGVKLYFFNNVITMEGEEDEVKKARMVLENMIEKRKKGESIDETDINGFIERALLKDSHGVIITPRGVIRPKTENQQLYVESIDRYTVVVAIGPAGTGKTFLAVAKAVESLENKRIERIILTRPAVEAGESLGFLPGDMREKVLPYLRPLYDALYQMLPADKVKKYIADEVIEIAPLAYMRGRTFSDAFIILDEAQNTTASQMKMFLTRLGWNSKAIVTGDITQIDLKQDEDSGLIKIQKILSHVEGIKFVYLDKKDVVRPKLVSDIIEAYEKKSI